MSFRFSELVGTHRLIVSAEHLRFVEEALVSPLPLAERAVAREEALREAAQAELEVLPDGTLISRAGAREFLRAQLPIGDQLHETMRFQKAPGVWVELSLDEAGRLRAVQPGKPLAVFERVG